MYTLKKVFTFEAAHRLPLHDGKCARLHGHSWQMEVEVGGEAVYLQGPKSGMVQDFADISAAVKPLMDETLDHHYLNETTKLSNPTSEELAYWLFHALWTRVPRLIAVTVRETCTSACRYAPWEARSP